MAVLLKLISTVIRIFPRISNATPEVLRDKKEALKTKILYLIINVLFVFDKYNFIKFKKKNSK